MSVASSIAGGGQPTSLPPSGAAGGDLGGTYPNPTVTDDSHAHTATTLAAATTAAAGVVELATDGETIADRAVQGNDSRLARVPVSSFLAANATNATAVMAATGLSVPVTTGKKYRFEALLKLSDSTPADGAHIDFDGGSAAATNFWGVYVIRDGGAELLQGGVVALATDIGISTLDGSTDDGWFEVRGSFEPSSTGTFAIRFAQVAHTTGTLTLYRGSYLAICEVL